MWVTVTIEASSLLATSGPDSEKKRFSFHLALSALLAISSAGSGQVLGSIRRSIMGQKRTSGRAPD